MSDIFTPQQSTFRLSPLQLDSKPKFPLASLPTEFYNSTSGALSPDIQSNPLVCPSLISPERKDPVFLKIGRYLLTEIIQTSTDASNASKNYRAVHLDTEAEFVCKVLPVRKYRVALSPYFKVGDHPNISSIQEIIVGEENVYVFFQRHYGDLHSFVRTRRRLAEPVARGLFVQILSAVRYAHSQGVLIRDVKLRKFVFKDPTCTQLMLDGLEDAVVLERRYDPYDCSIPHCLSDDSDDHSEEFNDLLTDKHGCPAYVSPEILNSPPSCGSEHLVGYSGRAAAAWSLGVLLYTMLVGRYPFHDVEPAALFAKIRRGRVAMPASDGLSAKARCLVKGLLRTDPNERLTVADVFRHPWLREQSKPELLQQQRCSSHMAVDISDDLSAGSLDNSLALTGSLSSDAGSTNSLISSVRTSASAKPVVDSESDQTVPSVKCVKSVSDSLIFS